MKAHSITIVLISALAALTSGCAGFGAQPGNNPEQLLAEARGPEENRKLHTDLIREMIGQERLYAAYAHLQAQERSFGDNLELKLLRAEIQRKLGRSIEAEADYKKLLDTPYEGYARHGLGLIYAKNNIVLGTKFLREAVELRPTDANMRNDLGYALMRQNKYTEARLHLATAFQLDSGSSLSRNNYMLILLLEGDQAEAARVARQTQIPPQQIARLKQQAKELGRITVAPKVSTPSTSTEASLTIGGGGG